MKSETRPSDYSVALLENAGKLLQGDFLGADGTGELTDLLQKYFVYLNTRSWGAQNNDLACLTHLYPAIDLLNHGGAPGQLTRVENTGHWNLSTLWDKVNPRHESGSESRLWTVSRLLDFACEQAPITPVVVSRLWGESDGSAYEFAVPAILYTSLYDLDLAHNENNIAVLQMAITGLEQLQAPIELAIDSYTQTLDLTGWLMRARGRSADTPIVAILHNWEPGSYQNDATLFDALRISSGSSYELRNNAWLNRQVKREELWQQASWGSMLQVMAAIVATNVATVFENVKTEADVGTAFYLIKSWLDLRHNAMSWTGLV